MKKNSFYVTTPIYYANGDPHIGHAFTTLLADSLARFHRLFDKPVRFSTGTDEHGQKVYETALKNNKTPIEQADKTSAVFRNAWQNMNILYDDFIRTTETRHKKVVTRLVSELISKGDIYKGIYRGWYLKSEEDFYPDSRVHEISQDPENDPRLERIEEENYFFRLSSYTKPLLEHYKNHPDFVLPRNRRNEMISMLESGLEDLSISRAAVSWGIPVPGDEKQVIYVWIDALINYLSAAGIFQDEQMFQTFWPASVHIVGKDIIKFHAIIWPAMLLASKIELPETILVHGWILSSGEKMSKSKGNTQAPLELTRTYGSDVLRFTMFREISLSHDGNFDERILIERYNAELANGLGNLVQRSLGFAAKKLKSPLQKPQKNLIDTSVLKEFLEKYKEEMENYRISQALDSLWLFITHLNQLIDQHKPWKMIKENETLFCDFLWEIADALRVFAHAASPFLCDACKKILKFLNHDENFSWNFTDFGLFDSYRLSEITPLFPKIQIENEEKKEVPSRTTYQNEEKDLITMEEFGRIKMELATVVDAKKHPNAEKLLILTLSTSGGKKQVVSGIRPFYDETTILGKSVVFIKNLKPAELRGVLSEGMILAASNKKELTVLTCDHPVQEGSKVS